MYFLSLGVKRLKTRPRCHTVRVPVWDAAVAELVRRCLNPFTLKSDQCQISPAASPGILQHTVWRTWLFIASTKLTDDNITNSHYITYTFVFKRLGEWLYFLNLGVKGLVLLFFFLVYRCVSQRVPTDVSIVHVHGAALFWNSSKVSFDVQYHSYWLVCEFREPWKASLARRWSSQSAITK